MKSKLKSWLWFMSPCSIETTLFKTFSSFLAETSVSTALTPPNDLDLDMLHKVSSVSKP